MPPLAVAGCLEAVRQGLSLPIRDGMELEAKIFGQLCATEDKAEGTAAFLEKRTPVWRGPLSRTVRSSGGPRNHRRPSAPAFPTADTLDMLDAWRTPVPFQMFSFRSLPYVRNHAPVLLAPVLLTGLLAGCSSRSAAVADAGNSATTAQQRTQIEQIRQQLDLIPPPSKNRYMAIHSLSAWENPYLTVQGGMLTLHVTLADANPSNLGVGGNPAPGRRAAAGPQPPHRATWALR